MPNKPQAFTAIESLVLLLLISMLALTSLAVYRKKMTAVPDAEESMVREAQSPAPPAEKP